VIMTNALARDLTAFNFFVVEGDAKSRSLG
jgi:hypothetical protein